MPIKLCHKIKLRKKRRYIFWEFVLGLKYAVSINTIISLRLTLIIKYSL